MPVDKLPSSGANPTETVVRNFIDAVNAHDLDRIMAFCTADHEFIDAFGIVVPAAQLRSAWDGYFGFMPRYGIEVEEILCDGDTAAVFGHAWGGLDAASEGPRQWRRPAAWRVRVASGGVVAGRIRLWQVYVDTKIVFDLLGQDDFKPDRPEI